MSERTGRITVQLPLSHLQQLKLLREDMEKRLERPIKLEEIVAGALINFLEEIYQDSSGGEIASA